MGNLADYLIYVAFRDSFFHGVMRAVSMPTLPTIKDAISRPPMGVASYQIALPGSSAKLDKRRLIIIIKHKGLLPLPCDRLSIDTIIYGRYTLFLTFVMGTARNDY